MSPIVFMTSFVGETWRELAGLSRAEAILVIGAIACAIGTLVQLMLISRSEARERRIALLRDGLTHGREIQQRPPHIVARLNQRLGTFLARSAIVGRTEATRLTQALADAGLKGHHHLASLMVGKFAGLVTCVALTWSLLQWGHFFENALVIRFVVLAGIAIGGWRIADYGLGALVRRRRGRIEEGLPDALDLLVICAEAGLSLDQGIVFVAREIRPAYPDIATELDITTSELRVLEDRRIALQNFAARTGVEMVRSVVATLVQTMRYGTPLADSLRVLAAEMRTARILRVEEKASELPVMLSVPLVAFLLPSTCIVLLGPAILQIIDGLSRTNFMLPHS